MKTLKEFIAEGPAGDYVSVRFADETNKILKELALKLELTPIEKFHSTIVYAPVPLGIPRGITDVSGTATIKGIRYLGEMESPYRAVVLELDSDFIIGRFDHFTEKFNYVSTYNTFIPHVSLGYRPPEGLNLSKVELPGLKLMITNEIVEPLIPAG